jgi:hypothetical protein
MVGAMCPYQRIISAANAPGKHNTMILNNLSRLCVSKNSDVGIVLPHWLEANSTYLGPSIVDGVEVDGWVKAGVSAKDNTYFAAKNDSLPVQFFEHKKGKLKTWDFDLTTYTPGQPKASLFEVPATCQSRCKAFICQL